MIPGRVGTANCERPSSPAGTHGWIAKNTMKHLAAAIFALLVSACSSPKYEPLLLVVTDAGTGRPVESVDVTLRPLKFFLPLGDSPSPTPGNFQADRAVTSATGLVTLNAAGNAPSELTVSHPDYPLWLGLIEPREDTNGQVSWLLEPSAIEVASLRRLHLEIVPD